MSLIMLPVSSRSNVAAGLIIPLLLLGRRTIDDWFDSGWLAFLETSSSMIGDLEERANMIVIENVDAVEEK